MEQNSDKLSKIVFVGTFPPTEEGIATFNEDLVNAVSRMVVGNSEVLVVAVNLKDTSPFYFDTRVRWEIDQEILKTYKTTARSINEDPDVKCVVIQHEYGIYGGIWGSYITEFISSLNKPVITILHTVLDSHPYKTIKFDEVTDKIVKWSDGLIVLSKKSKSILLKKYPQAAEKVFYIPHGIHAIKFVQPKEVKADLGLTNKIVLTTFGLLSRDKGIEYVLKALPNVVEKYPNVLYQVLGQTHPMVRKREGEKYRSYLINLVKKLNLRRNVRFVDKYLPLGELLHFLQGTDLYIATSLNKDQAVSGTFSYALGSGRAVVSTDFTQAREVVKRNIGRLVPIKDVEAYSQSINELLSSKKELAVLNRNAYSKTRSMLWSNVARLYLLAIEKTLKINNLILPEINLNHLKRMTRNKGLLQFAQYDIPNEEYGVTLDDNARALIVTDWLLDMGFKDKNLQNLQKIYFKLIKKSQNSIGIFTNYFDIKGNTTPQNEGEMPIEHTGRALWALVETMISSKTPEKIKSKVKKIWQKAITNIDDHYEHLRPKAFIVKALSIAYLNNMGDENMKETLSLFSDYLVHCFKSESRINWKWFEDSLTYNNAIIPESLALASKATGEKEYLKIAESAFRFLIKKTFMGDVYIPIGQKGWYKRRKKRSYYDQQPEDCSSMVLGLITMYEITKKEKYLKIAKKAFSWFLGNNLNGIPIVNIKTGGVYDGLKEDGVNKNQGAESLVSYLLARIKIDRYS